MSPRANASSAKKSSPKLPRARDQREVIFEVAERLCGEQGLEAVSIRDIADQAKCNLAAINYYFGSRQNLLLTIFKRRAEEIERERMELLAPLMNDPNPDLRNIIRAMLTPLARRRMPESAGRPALQFICRALTAADPEIRSQVGSKVEGFQELVALFQRALPHLSFEEVCWRFHFMMSIEHMNPWDVDRLGLLSKGQCHAHDYEESLERAIDFAEAGFRAPAAKVSSAGKSAL